MNVPNARQFRKTGFRKGQSRGNGSWGNGKSAQSSNAFGNGYAYTHFATVGDAYGQAGYSSRSGQSYAGHTRRDEPGIVAWIIAITLFLLLAFKMLIG